MDSSSEREKLRVWHMYVWTKQPFFHAVAQAENVAEARELLLEEIGGGDGSCPEREKAAKWVREQQPTIFHRSNAEFSLTDSAELQEQEAYVAKLQLQIKELRAAPTPAPTPTVMDHKYFSPLCHEKGCQYLVSTAKKCGKNMGNDLLVIPCDLPAEHIGPCERNVWPVNEPVASTPDERAPEGWIQKLRELILDHDAEEDAEGNIVIRFNCLEWMEITKALPAPLSKPEGK